MSERAQALEKALKSLVSGVEALEKQWPNIEMTEQYEELVGFLFATLPIAQEALKTPSVGASRERGEPMSERARRALVGFIAEIEEGRVPVTGAVRDHLSLNLGLIAASLQPASLSPVWREMDSAPKDGTRVLVYWQYWSEHPFVAYFKHGRWNGEVALSEGDTDGPTHWTPLPALPVGGSPLKVER